MIDAQTSDSTLEQALEIERHARKLAELRLEEASQELYLTKQLVNQMAHSAFEADPFEKDIQACLNALCDSIGWPIGVAYIKDSKTNNLEATNIWYFENGVNAAAVQSSLTPSVLNKHVILANKVLASKKPVWVSNVQEAENYFNEKQILQKLAINTIIGFPLKVANEVIAVLKFFSFKNEPPNENLLSLLTIMSEELSRGLDKKEYKKALKLVNDSLEQKVRERSQELTEMNQQLENELNKRQTLEVQLVQSEKMASLGQLAAGVAHEINNPIGFVMSNLGTLSEYMGTLKNLLAEYKTYEQLVLTKDIENIQKVEANIQMIKEQDDLDFILSDLDSLLGESKEGIYRVKEIVQNLKSFSRLDEGEIKEANINDCLDTTLKIVWNELKYKCQTHRDYGDIPMIPCYAGQLNQVFMNLLVNAAQAMPEQGDIFIKTCIQNKNVMIEIRDTGTGIPQEVKDSIFDPFFTTKPVGKGTGLGLSIVYGIIQKHQGNIEVDSTVGVGTTFTITLPIDGVSK